jgi:hypothetical protein
MVMTKIYVTKYALTSGIFSVDGEISEDGTMASYMKSSTWFKEYAHGNDFHLTKESALSRAEEMRITKLQSLDAKAKQISAMKFSIKE